MTTETNSSSSNSEEVLSPQLNPTPKTNGKEKPTNSNHQKRMTLCPERLQVLVMQQLNQVNAKKDELTIAIKNLSDLATQLAQICAKQNAEIIKLKGQQK